MANWSLINKHDLINHLHAHRIHKSTYGLPIFFNRGISNQSLVPKSPKITPETINSNLPNVLSEPNDISKEDMDMILNQISDNKELRVKKSHSTLSDQGSSNNNELMEKKSHDTLSDQGPSNNNALTVKKSHDTLSDQGPSEENALTEKVKLSHENMNDNDNTSVIELDTSAPRDITNAPLSELVSNFVSQSTPQAETPGLDQGLLDSSFFSFLVSLDDNDMGTALLIKSHQIRYKVIDQLLDDLDVTMTLLDNNIENITVHVKEIEQSIYARTIENTTYINYMQSIDNIPLLEDDSYSVVFPLEPSENNAQLNPDNYDPNILDLDNSLSQNFLNHYQEDNLDRLDLILTDNSFIVDQGNNNVSIEPLDNDLSSYDIIYSDQIRADHFIHNNYSIDMSGLDRLEYRLVYEYTVESLDILDNLMDKHQEFEELEERVSLLNSGLELKAEIIETKLSDILEILSHLY